MANRIGQSAQKHAFLAALITSTAALPAAAQNAPQAPSTNQIMPDTVIVTGERCEQELRKYTGTAQSLPTGKLRALGINNGLCNIQALAPDLRRHHQL